MLSRLTLTFLLLAILAASAGAQERGSISGKVTDKKTGHAIPFANVTVPAAHVGGLTDSEGQYRLGNVPAGTYDVKVQFLGYRPEEKAAVVVTAGKNNAVDFQLTDIIVHEEKAVEVSAERRLVEVKQGATIRSVTANDIRNLPVQTLGDVLQQQAGVSVEDDQIHVRGGRSDETVFLVNGVANRDLVGGGSTAGTLNARSVSEVNVATGAYDVRYGNALSGVVDVKLKEGGDKLAGGLTLQNGSYGGRSFQIVAGGPDPVIGRALRFLHLDPAGTMSSILDVSGSLNDTRYLSRKDITDSFGQAGAHEGFFERLFSPSPFPRLKSGYEDSFFGKKFHYGNFFTPAEDNAWSARYGLTWKPTSRDKVEWTALKRIAIDQGFSRTFISATGSLTDPSFPWQWARRFDHGPTVFEDNVQTSAEWRRTLSSTAYTQAQVSRYFHAERHDVNGKLWPDYIAPRDVSLFPLPDPRGSDFFNDSGDDFEWLDSRTTSWNFQGSAVGRPFHHHELEAGIDHDFQTVQYVIVDNPWNFDPSGLGDAHDLWRVHPWVGDLYVRDRIEYEGFVGNLGLRADYWFLGREAEQAVADTSNHNFTAGTRTAFEQDTRSFFGRRYKMHVSPRVIVAHPITENSSFFFNYGQFTQNPQYRYVYTKLTSVSSESFSKQGNVDLNPEVSINYEVGAKDQFTKSAAFNVTFFVKDVYDYPLGALFKRSQGTNLVSFTEYLNGAFARAKGFEVELEKRRTHLWSGRLSYTFQQAKAKGGNPSDQQIVEDNGVSTLEPPLSESFADYNRPHKITASGDIRFDKDAPFAWLERVGLDAYLQAQSGRPYTPRVYNAATGNYDQIGEVFSRNAPMQFTLDLKLDRAFVVAGRRFSFGLQGTNVFSNHLITRVDPVTGHGLVWGRGIYSPQDPTNNLDDPNPDKAASALYKKNAGPDNPSNYGPGAQWRLTVDYDF